MIGRIVGAKVGKRGTNTEPMRMPSSAASSAIWSAKASTVASKLSPQPPGWASVMSTAILVSAPVRKPLKAPFWLQVKPRASRRAPAGNALITVFKRLVRGLRLAGAARRSQAAQGGGNGGLVCGHVDTDVGVVLEGYEADPEIAERDVVDQVE
jgi:hypothetical protein